MTTEDEKEFQRIVTEGLVPKLKNSNVAVAICPSVDHIDAKFCVELGAMVMMDKPILIVVAPGDKISDKLRRIADEVVVADLETQEGQRFITEAMTAFSERFKDE